MAYISLKATEIKSAPQQIYTRFSSYMSNTQMHNDKNIYTTHIPLLK